MSQLFYSMILPLIATTRTNLPYGPTASHSEARKPDRTTRVALVDMRPKWRVLYSGLLVAALMAIALTGCQTPQGEMPPQARADKAPGALAAGDVVKVTFPGAPELNQSQKVRADGKVSLPLIGEVEAVGKRLGDFQAELARLYKPQLKNSEVVVALEASAIPVYVSGAVNKPGKIVLDRPMTVLEGIMEAGGISNLGSLTKVVVIRNANGKHFTQTLNLSPALNGRTTNAFYLRPYDMIVVPERFF